MKRHYFNLVLHRARLDLKAEAAQNYVGMLWWVLEPLLYLAAFYTIFEVFLQRGGPGFVGFLLCGLVFWRWFDTTAKKAGSAILGNGNLINQIYLPKWVFPLTAIAGDALRFCFVFVLFMLFAAVYGNGPSREWFAVVPLLALQLLFIVGWSFLLSVLIPVYPDLRKVVENFMLLMFYMSGIFFDVAHLGTDIQRWLNLNPMAVLIQAYRQVLLHNQWPAWDNLVNVLLSGAILTGTGIYLLRRMDRKLPHYVS